MVDAISGGFGVPSQQFSATGKMSSNSDNAALLSNLTASDWALGSAAVGHELDRSSQIQPLMLWQIAISRRDGGLPSSQPVTVNHLKDMAEGQTNQGYVDSINNAINYLLRGKGGSLDVYA
jgi:hypothetical protein